MQDRDRHDGADDERSDEESDQYHYTHVCQPVKLEKHICHMRTPSTVSDAVRIGAVPAAPPVLRPSKTPDRSHDFFDPAAGGPAERTAERLGGAGPVKAGAIVVGIAYVVLTAVMIGAGLVLTKLVLDGRLGTRDADVNRWFAGRRAATWDDGRLRLDGR